MKIEVFQPTKPLKEQEIIAYTDALASMSILSVPFFGLCLEYTEEHTRIQFFNILADTRYLASHITASCIYMAHTAADIPDTFNMIILTAFAEGAQQRSSVLFQKIRTEVYTNDDIIMSRYINTVVTKAAYKHSQR